MSIRPGATMVPAASTTSAPLAAIAPSIREYFQLFGLNAARLAAAKEDVIIMHPGPMNRGVEIASEVADGPYSVILEQVAHGVSVRMAVLYLLSGSYEEAA